MKPCRIGLVGAGWIGAEHGRNILKNPRAELAAICDAKADNIGKFKQATGSACREYTDFAALLKDKTVEAVVIASPNGMHAEMCVKAAAAGKHIYCEKPMALSLDDCARVRDAVEKAGVRYLIGYHRRLNPLYQYAKNLLDGGALGKLFLAESDYIHHVPAHWDIWTWLGKEAVAGSLFHAGSGHNVDLLRYLCGEIREVACMKGVFLPREHQVETEDTALAIFSFASGAIGKVHFSVGPKCPFQFNLRLYGTSGTLLNNRLWLDSMPRFDEPGREDQCISLPQGWIPDNVQGGVSETWDKLMDHFVAMLLDDAPCINDVHSAFATSQACFAVVEAARSRRVIEINR